MPGITRLKTWIAREVLVYSDLNDEFDNIINNLGASNVDGYSASVAQMQEQTNPGGVGSESLALRLSDEIKRLRFAISRIVGKTYWYEAPSRSLQATYSDANLYLQASPYVGASSLEEAVSESMLAGFVDSDNFDDANWLDTTNKKMADTAFAFRNDPVDSRYFYMDMAKTSATSSTLSFWFRNFAANDTIFYNPLSGLRVYLNANGFLKLDQTTADSVTNGVKLTSSITGSTSLAGSSTFNNVIVRYRYANASTDQVDLLLNGTLVGSISGAALPINQPTAPASKGVIFANRSPNAASELLTFPNAGLPNTLGWTKTSTGSPTESAVAGVLTLTAAASSDTLYYAKNTPATSLPTDGYFVEMKFKFGPNVGSPTDGAVVGAPFGFYLHTNTDTKGVYCRIAPDAIVFNKPASGAVDSTFGPSLSIEHNSLQWTHLFCVVKPAVTFVFVNGELKGSFTTPTDTTAGSQLLFGKLASSNVAPTVYMEYLLFGTMAGSNPDFFLENATNTQQISDPCAIRGFVTDAATISSLQTSSPFSVFGKAQRVSNFVSNRSYWLSTSVPTATASALGTVADFYSDGVTPVKINCMITARPSAATAGAYHLVGYLKLARSSDGAAQHVTSFVSSTTNSTTAVSGLSAPFYFVNVAAAEFQADMPIQTSMLLPAGKYTATAVLSNLASAATMIVNKVRCSVST